MHSTLPAGGDSRSRALLLHLPLTLLLLRAQLGQLLLIAKVPFQFALALARVRPTTKRVVGRQLALSADGSFRRFDAERMSQTTMNIAAITGPRTMPFMPKISSPPSVEISTT